MSAIHDDIEQDTLAAMQQQGLGPDVPLVPPAFTHPVMERVAPSRESRDVSAGVEGLYDDYPIGDGSHRIRVVRTYPDKWDGVSIAGVIEDTTDKMDSVEFNTRYGGGVYRVQVLGYEQRPNGNMALRVKREITVKAPGKPNPKYFGVKFDGGDDMSALGGDLLSRVLDMSQADRVNLTKALLEKQAAPSTDTMRLAQEMASERAEDVRRTMGGEVSRLQEELKRVQSQLSIRDDKVRELNDELVKIQREFDRRHTDEEMRRVTELKSQQETMSRELSAKHEDEMRRTREEHDRRLSTLREQFDSERSQMLQRWDTERREWVTKIADELRRAEQSAKERLDSLKDMHTTQMADLRNSGEQRLADAVRNHTAALATLRDVNAAQLESIKSNESVKASSIVEQANTRVQYAEKAIQEMRSELKRLKEENDALRLQQFKPVHQAIQEARDILGEVGVAKGESDDEEEKPKTWQEKMMDLALAVAPGLVQATTSRIAGPQAGQQSQPEAPALPSHIPAGAARPMPPAQQAPRRRAARPPAPGGWDGPPVPGGVSVPPPPDYPVAPARAPAVIPAGAAQPMATGTVVSPVAAANAPPEVYAGAPVAAPAPAPVATPIPDEQLKAFIFELDRVIASDEKTADDFAKEFVATVGPAVAQQVIAALSPDQLVEFVKNMPDGNKSVIVTRSGRQYLTRLWVATSSLSRKA